MIRRVVLPLGLIGLAFGAFAWAALAFSDAHDVAGMYFAAVALVALRAQQRMASQGSS